MNINSINRVELQGRVGTVRMHYAGDVQTAVFSIATETVYENALTHGTVVETTWHSVATRPGLKQSLDGLSKGALVRVTGRLRNTRYTDANGIERTFTEVVADSLEVLKM